MQVMPINIKQLEGKNPFIKHLKVQMHKLTPHNTYELEEGMIIPKEQMLDGMNATKLFKDVETLKVIGALSPNAAKCLLYIMGAIRPATDYIWINPVRYMRLNYIRSRQTLYTALQELIRCDIIAKTRFANTFYINPAYFYCGSRPRKYPSKVFVKVRKKRAA